MTSDIAVKKSGQEPLHLRRYLGEPCPDLAPQWSGLESKVLQGEYGGLPRLSPMLRRFQRHPAARWWALPVLRRIVQNHRHQAVLVVSHKGTNRLLVSSLLGFDARGYRDRLDQSPAGLTILDFATDVRARLRLFNDVSHYEGVPTRVLQKRLSRWWSRPGC